MSRRSDIVAALQGAKDAIDAAIETLAGDSDPTLDTCRHPEDRRSDLSTMGNPRWMCLDCKFICDPAKE